MIPPVDASARSAATAHLDRMAKPRGSLGRLEDLIVWSAGVQGRCPPAPFTAPRVVVVAGDHRVARLVGTSAYPPDVTAQMVTAMVGGVAAVNVLADRVGASVRTVDAGVDSDYPGLDVPDSVTCHRIRSGAGAIDREDALTPSELAAALDLGHALVAEEVGAGGDLLVIGDMGIGNTTPAAALVAALTDGDPVTTTGRGTGVDDATWMRKVTVVRDALWRCRDDRDDPLELLRRMGGPDLAVMTGALLGAAESGVPVLLDGSVVTAAALVAHAIEPGAAAWWCAAHRSAEPNHAIALAALDLDPLIDVGMRLGEASGALVALPVLQAALALADGMATFESAGVADRDGPDGPDTGGQTP